MWKAFDSSEGVEVAWNTLCLDEVPRSDKKRILNEIKILEKVRPCAAVAAPPSACLLSCCLVVSVMMMMMMMMIRHSSSVLSHSTGPVRITTPHGTHMAQLDHPNIITFYTSWYNKDTRRIVFITELMNNNNNGSLLAFVKPIPVLRWKIVKRWLRQMLEGLAFLHGQQPPIIHRNINCENIFIIANTGELKVGDLGLSTAAQRPEGCVEYLRGVVARLASPGRVCSVCSPPPPPPPPVLTDTHIDPIGRCVGTAPFMAPELFEEDYDEKVDIYAFGMAILQMTTKKVGGGSR